jgi:hypothetical protein
LGAFFSRSRAPPLPPFRQFPNRDKHPGAVFAFAGSVFRAVALGIFLLSAAFAIPPAVSRTVRWVGQAASVAGEDLATIRRRFLGDPWVSAIEEIRRTIPRDGEYLLVNGGTKWGGGPYWVRFDLAPRRARFLGLWSELPAAEALRRRLPPGPRYVVIGFREPQPPILIEREDFLRLLERSHGGL